MVYSLPDFTKKILRAVSAPFPRPLNQTSPPYVRTTSAADASRHALSVSDAASPSELTTEKTETPRDQGAAPARDF
jgi:hypothetical protein